MNSNIELNATDITDKHCLGNRKCFTIHQTASIILEMSHKKLPSMKIKRSKITATIVFTEKV